MFCRPRLKIMILDLRKKMNVLILMRVLNMNRAQVDFFFWLPQAAQAWPDFWSLSYDPASMSTFCAMPNVESKLTAGWIAN